MKRVYGLDILRAVAILLVIFGHATFFFHSIHSFIDGVSLFFVLSGYLIGGILLKIINTTEFTTYDLVNFWKRRWLRTLPAYYFTITVLILLAFPVRTFFSHITENVDLFRFTQSVVNGIPKFYPESWSLAIEEWFYLIIPFSLLILLSLLRNKKQVLKIYILSAIIIFTLFRLYACYHFNVVSIEGWDKHARKATLTRMDSIMFGFLGAYLNYYKYKIWQKKNMLFFIGLALLITDTFITSHAYTFYYSLSFQSIGVLLLIPKLASIKTGKGIAFNFFTFISKVSYSMYLINFSPFFVLIKWRIGNVYLSFFVWLVWVIVGAYLMYRFIEKPFMNLRDRKPYKGLNKIDEREEYISIETSR